MHPIRKRKRADSFEEVQEYSNLSTDNEQQSTDSNLASSMERLKAYRGFDEIISTGRAEPITLVNLSLNAIYKTGNYQFSHIAETKFM